MHPYSVETPAMTGTAGFCEELVKGGTAI